MLIVGERINSSRRSIAEAIEKRDRAFIEMEARSQAEAGAAYIDVNAGTFVGKEVECLTWLIEAVQDTVDLPLCIDSPDGDVIRAVLPMVKRTPMINSITLEPSRINTILPLAAERKAKLVALCQAEDSLAESGEQKLNMAQRLVDRVMAAGIAPGDLYIDPLVYPLSTNAASALATLEAIEGIVRNFPGVHTICGLTNVSYGLPARKLVNRTFLVTAVARGLDAAIMDPTDRQLFGALRAALLVANQDEFCMEYISAFRAGRLES
jgi:5-methyltetrahydrofolate--homocysteine methyltransferase